MNYHYTFESDLNDFRLLWITLKGFSRSQRGGKLEPQPVDCPPKHLHVRMFENFHQVENNIDGALNVKVNLNEGNGNKESTGKGNCQARFATPVKCRIDVVLAHLVADRLKRWRGNSFLTRASQGGDSSQA